MRRCLLILLALGGCGRFGYEALPPDAAPLDAPPAEMYCLSIPALPADPTIDGVIDVGAPPLAELATSSWTPDGPHAFPPGHRTWVAVAWRPTGIYVFVTVDDTDRVPHAAGDNPYWGDSVELYVDTDGAFAAPPAYDDPGTRQFVVAAPANDTDAVVDGESFVMSGRHPWTGQYVATPRPGGYTVEVFLTAADFGLSWRAVPALASTWPATPRARPALATAAPASTSSDRPSPSPAATVPGSTLASSASPRSRLDRQNIIKTAICEMAQDRHGWHPT